MIRQQSYSITANKMDGMPMSNQKLNVGKPSIMMTPESIC